MNTSTITLNILADNIPENDETFTITLTNPSGGAQLADENIQSQLVITGNDSPVRFSAASVSVLEDNGTVVLTIYRGIQNGVQIGPTDQVTTVQYSTSNGSAIAGQDYTESSGTVTFPAGSTNQIITIPILNDITPEGDEMFTVTLENVSSDSVLQTPFTTTVIISINDNAGGVVRFESTDIQTISEDSQTTATYTIERTVGTLGNLTISWSILDSNNQLATSDFNPANGTVYIVDGKANVDLEIQAFDDTLPEVAEMFTVTIDEVVNGEGKLDNQTLRITTLYVADSDDVYGVVEIVEDSGSIGISMVS